MPALSGLRSLFRVGTREPVVFVDAAAVYLNRENEIKAFYFYEIIKTKNYKTKN